MTAKKKNSIGIFKTTSIYPFGGCAIPEMKEEEYTAFQPDKLVKKTRLKYIPMYCPSLCQKSNTLKTIMAKENNLEQKYTHHQSKSTSESTQVSSLIILSECFSRATSPYLYKFD